MAYITISEIIENAYSEKWLPFRDELTELDVAQTSKYVKAGGRPGFFPEAILGTGGERSVAVHRIRGFLPSSMDSSGLFWPRMKRNHVCPEYPVVLASGIPKELYSEKSLSKWLVGNSRHASCVTVDTQDNWLLLSGCLTDREISVDELCGVLTGTGVCSIPSSLFYLYTGACLSGMSQLYRGKYSQHIHHDYWDTLPSKITAQNVLRVRGQYDATSFVNQLAYIAEAVNSTLQDRKTVRELAVKHGIIERV